MMSEKMAPIIGIVLLVVGIVILMFTFIQALGMINGAGDYFDEQFPEDAEAKGPTSRFSWDSNDLIVNFNDESDEGDSGIKDREWTFGDGETSSEQDPVHTYGSDGNYRVRLKITDDNDLDSSSATEVFVENGNQQNGESENSEGDFDFNLGLDIFAAAILVSIMYLILFLVGAALVKAGWNLIKTGPSTIKLKIKPKKLEVEQTQPQAPPYQPPYEPPRRRDYGPPPVEPARRRDYGPPPGPEDIDDWDRQRPPPRRGKKAPPPPGSD